MDSLKCGMCKRVAEEPWQHGKCGQLFCRRCLEVYGREIKPCPECGMKNPRYFEDNRGKKDISTLQVKCTNVDSGCEWEGNFGTLQEHTATCVFSLILCPKQCKVNDKVRQFVRKDLAEHLRTECPYRDHECENCGKTDLYVNITQTHNKMCQLKIVPCPNHECAKTMTQQDTKLHLDTECLFTVLSCKYKGIGCDVEIKRKDMLAHEQNEKQLHLHMALGRVTDLEKAVDTLSRENAELKSDWLVTFKLTDYEAKKKTNRESRSPSFFTGSKGYRVVIEVYTNGYGEGRGTHMSVYAYVLNGKYDSELTWPFVGGITVTLLNQLENRRHLGKTIVMKAERNMLARDNWGYPKFIPHSKLGLDVPNTQYLKDDTLYFRVSVEVAGHKPWLECALRT